MTLTPGIARYLLELDQELALPPGERHRVLAEVEEHLADAVAAGTERGLSLEAAEHDAVARFGEPATVAAAFAAGAGLHAAPSTLLRRFDVWRLDHPWLGSLVATVPIVCLFVGVELLFAGILPARDRSHLLRALVGHPLPGLLLVGWVAGQRLLAHAVRDRSEPTFSGRLASFRRAHPMRTVLLLMGPLAAAWAAAALAGDDVPVVLVVFILIPVVGAIRRRPRLWRMRVPPAAVLVLVPLGGLVYAALRGSLSVRLALAATAAVIVYAAAWIIPRRLRLRLGAWTGALVHQLGVAAAMWAFGLVATGRLNRFTVVFPLAFSLLMTPMLALSIARSVRDADHRRLAEGAQR